MFHRAPVAMIYICIGIGLLGILGGLLPMFSAAEEDIGLHVLYLLRGPEKAPAEVVVVAIDRESSRALNLPTAPHKWPRTLHARLLEGLSAQKAAVVAFDLIFYEHQSIENDRAFAAAIRQAGNVILTQTIDRRTMPLNDRNGVQLTQLNIEKMVSAIPILADAAAGQAPFPLPKVPVKLSRYWRFRPGSGDAPTLPVVALHAFAGQAFNTFMHLLRKSDPVGMAEIPSIEEGITSVRQIIGAIGPIFRLFEKNPGLAERLLEDLKGLPSGEMPAPRFRIVKSLIELYQPGNSRFLNLYGPPGAIQTISYHKLLSANEDSPAMDRPSLKGKAVFVGQTESDWYKANDGFYTAFTGKSGMDISGVEIAATAFANLLQDKAIIPLAPSAYFSILFGLGALGAWISLNFATAGSACGLLLLNGSYLLLAYVRFKTGGVWYPLVVPLMVQMPVAFTVGLVWKYRRVNRERRNIRKAFGYYLPDDVVDRLTSNIIDLRTGGQVLYSICLFTDAESYTVLSESMDPEGLTELMNSYYEAVFKPIKENKGLVLQVVGDSVLAIWTAPKPDAALKEAACRAAIGITESVRQFNISAGQHPLPTRIGIHAGEILLGNIGAMDHYEYRPVGDIVNTASRLEGLNKFLGTRMLASQEAFGKGNGYLTRYVGRFVFKGKSHPVGVRQIFSNSEISPESQPEVCRLFESGLQAFETRRWNEAAVFFNQVRQLKEDDGPSRFYLDLCERMREEPPAGDWDGSVRLDQK